MTTHRPRKQFGQNFLQHQGIIAAILQAFNPQPHDHVIEIGPGLGALTHPLLNKLHHLTVIEIDRDLQAYWTNIPQYPSQLTLLKADALTVDFSSLGSSLRLIGNLPYNISTPLLFHCLNAFPAIQDMHFMLQKEVVDRLASPPGSKTYGRLSVMVQYDCEVTHLFDVPPAAFDPPPKVQSAVVRLSPYQHRPYPEVSKIALETLVTKAFSMRRKTLSNNLKGILSADELIDLGLNPTTRPEQLSINEFVRIVQYINK